MANQEEIDKVWEKGKPIKGKNPKHRKDSYGNEIYKPSYGKSTDKGWEIDHKKPINKGGSNSMKNKQPLQTSENKKKSDTYPYRKSNNH